MNKLSSDPLTRPSLLIRLRDPRDDQAWTEFAAIYEPVIYRLAKLRSLQDADAREVVQEVLISVTGSIDRFEATSDGTFRGWLSRITRNATIDHLRKRSRRDETGISNISALADGLVDHLADDQGLSDAFDLERRQQLFRWASREIRQRTGERNWMAFWRTAVENQSIDQVANELSMKRGDIYVARCRVLKRIRELVHERLND